MLLKSLKAMTSSQLYRFVDIGVNLTDPVFKGVYHEKKAHEDDFSQVLKRAKDGGMKKMIVTVGHLEESPEALELCKTDESLFCTIGCHPTRCNAFEKETTPEDYYGDLLKVAVENKDKVVAIGECGLDYDREHFCSRGIQKKYFEKQFELARETKLPMFLHMRNACDDFVEIFKRNRESFYGGVAHCFTGTSNEAKVLLDLGLYIGITGCSLKTEDNLKVVKEIPSERLLIETDAPWCEVKNTHAGSKYVITKFPTKKKERWESGSCIKSRNEPCHIVQVLEILAALREEDPKELSEIIFKNSEDLFFSRK